MDWDPNVHVWKAGDDDMTLLPVKVTVFYNTTGWMCVNTCTDGDGVVFKRPPAPIKVCGCGTLHKRKNFVWGVDMGIRLHKHTAHLGFKSISFPALVRDAQDVWGYMTPKQENLENKIHSRDKTRKEGRTM